MTKLLLIIFLGITIPSVGFSKGNKIGSSINPSPTTDYKKLVEEFFKAIIESEEYNEDIIRRYFSDDYVQYVDGKTLNFDQFLQHIKTLKARTSSIKVHFKTLVQEGNVLFSNHIITANTK